MPLNGIALSPVDKLLSLEERKRVISIFSSLGVNKIRFTGGEPTLSRDLIELITHARAIPTMKLIGYMLSFYYL